MCARSVIQLRIDGCAHLHINTLMYSVCTSVIDNTILQLIDNTILQLIETLTK